MVGAKVRKGWHATPVSSDVRHQPVAQPAVVATTRPVCCGAYRTQSGGGISRGPWTPLGRLQTPVPLAGPIQSAGAGRASRSGLYISTLHVSLIIRVLPRAESATGCIFRQRRICADAIHVQGWCFRSVRQALHGSDKAGQGHAKKNRREMEHRTCRFFRSSLLGAGGDSRHLGKLAHTPSDGLASSRIALARDGAKPCVTGLPLWAAFATIAAMIKCFNSIKIVMILR